jgi:hypothetical protein
VKWDGGWRDSHALLRRIPGDEVLFSWDELGGRGTWGWSWGGRGIAAAFTGSEPGGEAGVAAGLGGLRHGRLRRWLSARDEIFNREMIFGWKL